MCLGVLLEHDVWVCWWSRMSGSADNACDGCYGGACD